MKVQKLEIKIKIKCNTVQNYLGGKFMENFIVTTDKYMAEKFISAGLRMISHKGDVYTFLNQPPENFNFENFDKTKFCFTNMFSF